MVHLQNERQNSRTALEQQHVSALNLRRLFQYIVFTKSACSQAARFRIQKLPVRLFRSCDEADYL
jgi:hypothetical protein